MKGQCLTRRRSWGQHVPPQSVWWLSTDRVDILYEKSLRIRYEREMKLNETDLTTWHAQCTCMQDRPTGAGGPRYR